MFVTSSSSSPGFYPSRHPPNFHPSFPAKPKPLQPIFTFVQSQSSMNLGMDLLVHSTQKATDSSARDCWVEKAESWFEVLAPAKPQLAYKSPLQRVGEALRAHQTKAPPLPMREADINECGLPPPMPQSSLQQLSVEHNPTLKHPDVTISQTGASTAREFVTCSGQDYNGLRDLAVSRNNSYFAGTSLLYSLFSSNPRTRAPFKPQKSGRGTPGWQLKQYAEATLGSGSLRKAVKLPEGEDKDEWLAVNGEPTDIDYRSNVD